MSDSEKHVLLIDLDDSRGYSRVRLLESAGYGITVHNDHGITKRLANEDRFDSIVLTLHAVPQAAATFSDRLTKSFPCLPILLLTDVGVYVPKWTLSRSMESGSV
jgi:hypothetical protein